METKITEVSGWTKEAKEEFTPNAPVKVIKQTPLTWKKEETFYTCHLRRGKPRRLKSQLLD